MSLIRRRKLTQNQTRRIAKNTAFVQDDRLASGIVVAHFGKQLDVQITEQGSTALAIGKIYRCHTRTNLPMLATGDKVQLSFDDTAHLGRIEQLMPRQSLITRPDRYQKIKPVASNVELLIIVFAPLPKPATHLIDRYLLVAHITNTPPLLLLNKHDILDNDTQAIYQQYHRLGYPTLSVSCYDKTSLTKLKHTIQGKLSIFAGQSGVGKSSLINALLDNANQDTKQLSNASKLGQHTTTTSRLFAYNPQQLNNGGIIDTPGIREYGIWHLSKADILDAFFELAPLADQCQFRDCNHNQTSKGCALWQAASQGQVSPARIDSLLTLQNEALA